MPIYRFARSLAVPLFRFLYRIRIFGKENILPRDTSMIVCGNHTSNMDPILLAVSIDATFFFMAKAELFKIPVLGFLLKIVGAFPVKRNSHDISAIKKAMSVLKDGKSLMIFPEGTRNRNNADLPAKAGAVTIAAKTDIPVLPVGIQGPVKPFHKVNIVIGKPVYYPRSIYGHAEYEEYKRLSQDLLAEIKRLRDLKTER